jgi:hypothetical protein
MIDSLVMCEWGHEAILDAGFGSVLMNFPCGRCVMKHSDQVNRTFLTSPHGPRVMPCHAAFLVRVLHDTSSLRGTELR